MNQPPAHICLTTLDCRPHTITHTLDALLAHAIPIEEIIVVHLAPQHPEQRAGLTSLAQQFAGDCYAGRPCRYRRVPVNCGGQAVAELNDEAALTAALTTFHRLIQHLKRQDVLVHLCLSGTPPLLDTLAISAALLHLDQTDCIWYLQESGNLLQRSSGAVNATPDYAPQTLLRLPLTPWGHFFPALRTSATPDMAEPVPDESLRTLETDEYARCRHVVERLTARPREVLRAFAAGLTLQEVAEQMGVTIGTVHAHKTTIFEECRVAWGLPPEMRLSSLWLRDRFASYFAV